MNLVTNHCGDVFMWGRNLAVVLRYARKYPVEGVRIDHAINVDKRGEYAVTFYFSDGCQCVTYWASWHVLLGWLVDRRSWAIEIVRVASTGPRIPFNHVDAYNLRRRGVETAGFER